MRHLFLKHSLIPHPLLSQSRFQNMFHLEFTSSWGKVAMWAGAVFRRGPLTAGRDHPQLLALEWGESNSSHLNWGRQMESSCPSPRQNVAAVIILECGLGLPISESPYMSSLRCSNALDTNRKRETSACYQQASFLVGSLLTLPTTSCGFLRLPESPSA